jgi:geranylgeranyl pyrophosphate synthase/predicted secreted hydrolase
MVVAELPTRGPLFDRPVDWPHQGRIDLDTHDLPHASSTLEWWYVNAHARTVSGRDISLFASFFRTAVGRDEQTGKSLQAHALTWALIEPATRRYLRESLVDQHAPAIVQHELAQGQGVADPMLRRALSEVVAKGTIPGPDLVLSAPCVVGEDRLLLDCDGRRFESLGGGEYALELRSTGGETGCDLKLELQKPVVQHGNAGVVRGKSGEQMFYYFAPRCSLQGSITIDGETEEIAQGSAWYDHEFGRSASADDSGSISWDWLSLQLDNGWDLTLYCLFDEQGLARGRHAVLIDPYGQAGRFEHFALEGRQPWTSSKTFVNYPTTWRVHIPQVDLSLEVEAAFGAQEFVTMISRPAFWEGRVSARGHLGHTAVAGLGFVERSGFERNDTLPTFFGAVGSATRRSVESILPLDLDHASAAVLTGGSRHLEGIELQRLSRAMVEPVRTIVDRGGKAWRSYVALACCDAVGGDSQVWLDWLALPELMHVGSLMVDDIQDGSAVRRGGPAAHLVYGEPITINAGTACYFLAHLFVQHAGLDDSQKLRIYEQYFEATRAAHAGQALDLGGYADAMPEIVKRGDGQRAERHVRAVHHLKSAVPAGCLARIGAIVGHGEPSQIDALGEFVERVGLAFQIIDDVLNLRGFDRDYKLRGEDISSGKVTMPIAKAMNLLGLNDRRRLWTTLSSRPSVSRVVVDAIRTLDECGAIEAAQREAKDLVEDGWAALSPLIADSQAKLMLRAFSWFVLERHY